MLLGQRILVYLSLCRCNQKTQFSICLVKKESQKAQVPKSLCLFELLEITSLMEEVRCPAEEPHGSALSKWRGSNVQLSQQPVRASWWPQSQPPPDFSVTRDTGKSNRDTQKKWQRKSIQKDIFSLLATLQTARAGPSQSLEPGTPSAQVPVAQALGPLSAVFLGTYLELDGK